MRKFTCYFTYNNVYDLCAFTAASAEEAIAKAQHYFNTHADFADVKVTVYKAV
jgi:hypothetical protein